MSAVGTMGLPGPLPDGERLLWQGRPNWRVFALRALHARKIAVYFAVLLVWYGISMLHDGAAPSVAGLSSLRMTGVALVPLLLIAAYSWLTSRATVYSITTRRVVVRCGLVVPMTINIPFRKVEAADLRLNADGSGDIALSLMAKERLGYLLLWPHVRPWRMARAEPMLRAIADAGVVAQTLARALAASASVPVTVLDPPAAAMATKGRAGQHAAAAA